MTGTMEYRNNGTKLNSKNNISFIFFFRCIKMAYVSNQKAVPLPSDLRVRLKNLLTQQKHTDCSFRIDNVIINSHKVILSTASPVFEAMFFGPLAETCCIEISDISYEAFQLMLEYIYTDEVDMSAVVQIEDLMELYYCAKKYLLSVLMLKCDKLIRTTLRHENILQAIDMAVAMNIPELLDITLSFFSKYCLIGRYFSNIILKNDFHISKECLNFILASGIKQQNINLICLIKKWCRTEAKQLALKPDDVRLTLTGIQIPEDILDDVKNMHSLVVADNALKNSRLAWMLCQRQYYKAVRPLQIGQEQSFNTSIQSNRLIALRSLIINSRLTPLIRTSLNLSSHAPLDCKYTEQLLVKISTNEDFSFVQKFILFNTEYNSTVNLVFENPVMITPDITYAIKIQWPDYLSDCEYPRSVLSLSDTIAGDLCTIKFDQHLIDNVMLNQYGSILAGVEFVILN